MSCGAKTSPKASGGNEAPSGPTSEIELSGSISDEAPVDFVQSSSSVSVGQVNLTDATSYVVKAYSLDPSGSKKEIFTGSFAEPKFSFKSTVARQYMLIEITRLPDGGQYGAVLPPPTSNKQASLVVDGATTIASKMAALIASKAESGDQGAQQALTSGSVSVADLLMVAQSVRTTVIEQKAQNKGSAIDLSSLAANLISKSNELVAKLSAEGQSSTVVAERLSEASYKTIFGDDAKAAPAGVLAYRVNPDLGSSEAANTTVAYEAIKASVSDSTKAVDEAFRAEATAYRAAPSVAAAVAAKTAVTSDFKAVFRSCMTSPSNCSQTSYTPPRPPESVREQIKAPGAPTSVIGIAGDAQVSLTWSAPASNGGATITDYIVQYQSASKGGNSWTTVSDGTSTLTSVTVTGLTNGTGYLFRVAATNSSGTGSYSASSPSVAPVTTPGAPRFLLATAGDSQVELTWTAPASDGGASIIDYEVQYSYDDGISWTTFQRSASNAASTTVTGLWLGIPFIFRVAAINSVGTGSYSSNSASVTPVTIPYAPREVRGVPGDTQVELTWYEPGYNGGATINDYVIQYSSNGGYNWTTFSDGISTSRSATVTGLTNGTTYVFRVSAVNSLGTGSYSSNSVRATPPGWSAVTVGSEITMRDNFTGLWWSNYRGSMTQYTAKSHCESLSYNGQSGWRLPSLDELRGAYYSEISLQWRTGWITTDDTRFEKYFWSGSKGSRYDYVSIFSLESVWDGVQSIYDQRSRNVVCVRWPSPTPEAPTSVSGLIAGATKVILTWTAPESNGGASITDYVVQYKAESAEGEAWTTFPDGESTLPSTIVTGLTSGTRYMFRVAASNSNGTGLYSRIGIVELPIAILPGTGWTTEWTQFGNGSQAVRSIVYNRDNATHLNWANCGYTNLPMVFPGVLNEYTWFPGPYSIANSNDWRLPTEEELLVAYNHGINLQWQGDSRINNFKKYFWSQSTISGNDFAKAVYLDNLNPDQARTELSRTSAGYSKLCVRWTAPIPEAPISVTGSAGDAQVALTWTARSPGVGSFDKVINDYIVQYKTASAGEDAWTTFIDGKSAATSATVTGLTNGSMYVFRVAAVNDRGVGSYSNGSPGMMPQVLPTTGWSAVTVGGEIAIRDNLTKLWWSNSRFDRSFDEAASHCTALSYNGRSDWRSPSKNELLVAYNNGIRLQASELGNWIGTDLTDSNFWSWSISESHCGNDCWSGWTVNLSNGFTNRAFKSYKNAVICVAP